MNDKTAWKPGKPIFEARAVHLDLKGLAPSPERLLSLPRLFAAAGFNAVLVEWEDAFPWTVDERFRGPNAYGPETVAAFRDSAATAGLEIIPLVQCLGHLETPLGVPGYERLREVPGDPSCLNPLAEGALELVRDMVDDVLALLPETTRFHLGGDEAWVLGENPATAAYIAEHGPGALYLRHVGPLLDHLAGKGARPLLWHDMMVKWDEPALRELARRCDLVTWGYSGHPDRAAGHFATANVKRFRDAGFRLWAGTAFKGADGENSDLPDPARRRENALAWAEIGRRFGFRGYIATGWSRYSTNRVQCEPLDAALDRLLEAGAVGRDGRLPEEGACAALLESLGETTRFEACRQAMEKLAQLRRRGWLSVQALRETAALAGHGRPEKLNGREGKRLETFRALVSDAEEIEGETRRAFEGLLVPGAMEEYIHSRLAPLRDELRDLERLPGLD